MRELLPRLPIDVFAVFDGEHVQPLGTDTAVENAIGPDSVGPDLVLLKGERNMGSGMTIDLFEPSRFAPS